MSAPSERHSFDLDWLLAALATLVAGLAFTLLLTGVGSNRALADGPAIATLTSTLQDVRRRASGTLVWEDLPAGAPLALGDVLFVPPSSGAVVDFADGSRLELAENTFVALEPSGDRGATHQVRVNRGLVLGAASLRGGLNIETQAGVARLEKGAQARVSLSADSGARVDVLEGAAALEDGTRVSAHQTAIASGGAWKRSTWPVRLTEPAPLARFYFAGDAPRPVELRWSGELPADARLQVFDRSGTKVLDVDAGAAPSGAFTAARSGSYDWRIARADGTPLSESRRVTLVRDVPPAPLSPRHDELIHGYLGRKVPFGWSKVPGVRHYALEVADAPDFSRIVYRQEVTGTSHRVAWPGGEGIFFWRVRSQVPDERGESPWSVAEPFRYLEKPLPEAPEIIDSTLELDP